MKKPLHQKAFVINLLMLDMSKAFDTIQRDTLIEDLRQVLNNSKLFLIALLLKDVELARKVKQQNGPKFLTNIGSPQGDSASAIFFIIYLAVSLSIACNNNVLVQSEHNYNKSIDDHITIDQQYADNIDIGWATTEDNQIEKIQKDIPPILKDRNLFVNEDKTESYIVKRNGNEDWKKCKYVGSLLDTECDINRRKQQANSAYSKSKDVFSSKKVTTETKLRLINALIESIFLYNCEVWSLIKLSLSLSKHLSLNVQLCVYQLSRH